MFKRYTRCEKHAPVLRMKWFWEKFNNWIQIVQRNSLNYFHQKYTVVVFIQITNRIMNIWKSWNIATVWLSILFPPSSSFLCCCVFEHARWIRAASSPNKLQLLLCSTMLLQCFSSHVIKFLDQNLQLYKWWWKCILYRRTDTNVLRDDKKPKETPHSSRLKFAKLAQFLFQQFELSSSPNATHITKHF